MTTTNFGLVGADTDTGQFSGKVQENLLGTIDARVFDGGAGKLVGASDHYYARSTDREISARNWGWLIDRPDLDVIGESGDVTVEMQALLDFVTANKRSVVLPDAQYAISAPLAVKSVPGTEIGRGFGFRGLNAFGTEILQTTDNVHVFDMGVGAESQGSGTFRDFQFGNFRINYANVQDQTKTNAVGLFFKGMAFESEILPIYFQRGYWGMQVDANQVAPWGMTFRRMNFGPNLYGGAVDLSTSFGKVPNNHWEGVFVNGQNMRASHAFRIKGYNSRMDNVEFITMDQGAGLLDVAAGSSFKIGALKAEGGTYRGAAKRLVQIPTDASLDFDEFSIMSSNNGFALVPTSGRHYLFHLGSGGTAPARLRVGKLSVAASEVTNSHILGGGAYTSQVDIDLFVRANVTVPLAYPGGGDLVVSNTRIRNWQNGIHSTNMGDANVTVTPGATPTNLWFLTALTAPRTVSLPTDGTDLLGGLEYHFWVPAGIASATNPLNIVANDGNGARTLRSITETTAVHAKIVWRRTGSAGKNGWYVDSVASFEPPAATI